MGMWRRFEEIISWQKARDLNKEIFRLIQAKRFRTSYRLINQIEGSAGSIMDNIAEGCERRGNKEFIRFLYIAKASCGELRSQLYRALDCEYISTEEFQILSTQAMRISYLIQKLINYLDESSIQKSSEITE
jgi:four helix bundle protein